MGRVEGKVAVVTGAASGLGLASSRRLAAEGASVVMADINAEQGSSLAHGIPGAQFHQLDVTREEAWQVFLDAVTAAYGRIDVLMNCAGIVRLASIEETSEADWRAVHAVGTDGTFYGCKHVLPIMKAQGAGSIINMCSTASIQGAPGVFAYAASKAAIRAMTKSIACLSTENGFGIRCNSIHPYNMATPMLADVQHQVRQGNPDAAAGMDKIWVGEPEDVAHLVLFLASDESSAINGAAMVIDNTATVTQAVVMKDV
ncbi:MAG: SDR family oxidoreductase [Halioglobus sp.]|nr:SDR family oxidoreductase [Halioglobus sp.]